MRRICYIFISLGVPLLADVKMGGFAFTDEEIESMERGLAQWEIIAQESPHQPPEEVIPKMMVGIRKTSMDGIYVLEDKNRVNRILRESTSRIHGHADIIYDSLSKLKDDHKRNNLSDYNAERSMVFDSIRQVQTVEIIGMLIRLLDDDEDYEMIRGVRVYHETFGNNKYAANAIMYMVRDLPLQKDRFGYYRMDIPALQEWGREVMEGKRTFRFKEVPGVYNIDGKIQDERREAIIPIPASTPVVFGESHDENSSSSGVRWVALVAFLLLGVAIVKLWLGRGRAEV